MNRPLLLLCLAFSATSAPAARSADAEPYPRITEEAFKAPIRGEYETFANAYNFARNLWIDGVIEPGETREVMTLLLDVAGRAPRRPTRFGVFRM
jgi:3-methylcrotonyl-CoA carboxylase beta subunit